jgi:hypothetical protein
MSTYKQGDVVAVRGEVAEVHGNSRWSRVVVRAGHLQDTISTKANERGQALVAPWPDAERLAILDAALGEIRNLILHTPVNWSSAILRISDILDATGY